MTRSLLLVVASVLMAMPPALLAQPGDAERSPRRPEGMRERQFDISSIADPDRLRARLESFRDQVAGTAARLNDAIEILESGGSTNEAIDALGGPESVYRFARQWGGTQFGTGGGFRGPGMGRGGDQEPDLDDDAVLGFLRENAPEMAQRIVQLREREPERAEQFSRALRQRVSDILAARDEQPELAEIMVREFRVTMRVLEVSRAYQRARESESGNVEEVRAEIRVLANELIEVKLAKRRHEVEAIRKQLEAAEAEIAQQESRSEDAIEEMMDQLLRDGPDRRRGDGESRRRPNDRLGDRPADRPGERRRNDG